MTLTTRRMYCPDTEQFENVAVPAPQMSASEGFRLQMAEVNAIWLRYANGPDPVRDPFTAFYREQDMLDEFLGKGRK